MKSSPMAWSLDPFSACLQIVCHVNVHCLTRNMLAQVAVPGLVGKCVDTLQIHDANLVFGLEDNTSMREKKDGHKLFRHCRQASAATERVQNELKLGASHQAGLACLRGQRALAGCSIAPEVLLPILS
jgi:hypothetical protein